MRRTELIKNTMAGKTLDVGCTTPTGLGTTLHSIIYNNNVYGLDIIDCPNMKNFKQGDAQKMPYKDEMFDTVIAGELIEHLENPEKFLLESKRVLKDNGILIITTPNKKSWSNRIFGNYNLERHISLFNFGGIKKLVSKHFKIEQMFCLPYEADTVRSKHPRVYSFRSIIHRFLPMSLQENIIIVARKAG